MIGDAAGEDVSNERRELTRRSDYERAWRGRLFDLVGGEPTTALALSHGGHTALIGAWVLLPPRIYESSEIWREFAALGIPESLLGLALLTFGVAKMWLWGSKRGERYPVAHLVVASGCSVLWAFLFGAFAFWDTPRVGLIIPITGWGMVTSLWLTLRVGLAPRHLRPRNGRA
jgi:hypothetical protein